MNAGTKSANPLGAFRKRTITALEFVGEVPSIAAEASTFNKVWVRRELDPRFRETLMLAVARQNDSKYCSWAHHEWARIEGVSEARVAHIEHMDQARFDSRTWLAITFACELVNARFGPVDRKLMQEMRKQYTAEEIEEITLVAKAMDAANRSSNTFDAFLSRLSGKPSPKGRVVDEAILSAAFCAFAAAAPLLLGTSSIGESCRMTSTPQDGGRVRGSQRGANRTAGQRPRRCASNRRRPRKQPTAMRQEPAP
jgi:AhpD family alkylhydroperoxidase